MMVRKLPDLAMIFKNQCFEKTEFNPCWHKHYSSVGYTEHTELITTCPELSEEVHKEKIDFLDSINLVGGTESAKPVGGSETARPGGGSETARPGGGSETAGPV